ncbi:MAG TPA: UPF0179 family protein [Thermoplasmatales archaeon]|nr:UPF0179 family protein [Thermoplasmatales archaeon]
MPSVTLVGERMAKKGLEFIYMGPSSNCKNCKLKTACFNLKKGRSYRITGIREKRHSCNLHDGGVRVVEVEELPIIAFIDKNSKEGSKVKIDTMNCRHLDCEYFDICHSPLLQNNKEYSVIKIIEPVECIDGRELVKAEISDS